MTKKPHPGGRPTKYDKKYVEEALKYIGEQGKSVTQFAFHLKVSKSTVYEWASVHPEFSDALRMAAEWSQAVWEDKLEGMMYMKEVNSPLVKLYFANRFGWTEKGQDAKDEEEAKPLNITFEVRNSVAGVEITNAKP